MFIGDKSKGILERMNADQREHFHNIMKTKRENPRNEYELGWNDGNREYLSNMIRIAFANHPRPVKCTCGEYPPSVDWGKYISRKGEGVYVHCKKCFTHTKLYSTVGEAIIAWEKLINNINLMMKERGNG